MSKFNEVLDLVSDENIVRDSKTHFTFTGENRKVIPFIVKPPEPTKFIYNGTGVCESVILSFPHTAVQLTCELCATAIQYAVISLAESDLAKPLGVVHKDEGFTYAGEEFPGTLDEFKAGFAEMLGCLKSVTCVKDLEYPIESLFLGKNCIDTLFFYADEVHEDILSAAGTLLRPIFRAAEDTLPEQKYIYFGVDRAECSEKVDVYDDLISSYCDMYFDLHEQEGTPYADRLAKVKSVDYNLILDRNLRAIFVYGDVLGYSSTVSQSDRVGLATEYIVSNTDQPIPMTDLIIHALEH